MPPVLTTEARVVVIGLSNVGLPLAIELGKQYPTLGFDLIKQRVDSFNQQLDETQEIDAQDFELANRLSFTTDMQLFDDIDIYIITGSTPTKADTTPDLGALISASAMVGEHISAGVTVINESTVYSGATDDDLSLVNFSNSNLFLRNTSFLKQAPKDNLNAVGDI